MNTTVLQQSKTLTFHGDPPRSRENAILCKRYDELLQSEKLGWTEHLRLKSLLGTGGQGVVYLSERRGADSFTLPVALKFFSPERYASEHAYDEAMRRMAMVSGRVAQIAHDNLIDVQNFIERDRVRILEMEWVDGYDLDLLLTPAMLRRAKDRVSGRRWDYINNVIVTRGPVRPRLKPGMAVAIMREIIGGLAALHREEIVHGDIKPSNIMVKRTGNAKIIDIGSAIDLNDMPAQRTCTPQYAAPEMLEREEFTPRSDLASLGYVLIELLSGQPLFAGINDYAKLLEAKRTLPQRLDQLLPDEVTDSDLLMGICRRLTAPDPMLRYGSAEEADTAEMGFAEFQRTLVRGDLASEYENELRVWLEELD
ncbi:serine/threonine-protein kinase [Botrimarina mediterranea]|uniref:Serine/threonine-protein kinase PrkC n=1 Tax=Botrimarina mediterranea TaxID=2528022 RepID=A0A518KAU5_9BACT|nr:serine/threonine-protein kinase [Botrimarina mediterranea]QDV74911.1 Serine/threonine-protein kinase PrkC [Botrimarina mediterranea]QDV79555.1 Serine/threonine-protein kinase PrkC [Planctomycetes bacterium K2D]